MCVFSCSPPSGCFVASDCPPGPVLLHLIALQVLPIPADLVGMLIAHDSCLAGQRPYKNSFYFLAGGVRSYAVRELVE